MIKRGARTQDTATAFAGYGTGNRTPALVRYKNESINRLVTVAGTDKMGHTQARPECVVDVPSN